MYLNNNYDLILKQNPKMEFKNKYYHEMSLNFGFDRRRGDKVGGDQDKLRNLVLSL